jgi:hypothetical protein
MNSTLYLRYPLALALSAGLAWISSCAAIVDAKDRITGSEYADVQSGIHWNTQVPEIYLRTDDAPTVYFNLRNLAGEQDEEVAKMRKTIRQRMEQHGYRMAANPEAADFTVRGSVRYIGKNPRGPNKGSTLFGDVASLTAGAATGVAVYEAGGETGLAAGGGVAAGALVASLSKEGLDNASDVNEWDVLVDFVVSERNEGTRYDVKSSTSTSQADLTGTVDGASSRSGSHTSQETKKTEAQVTKNQLDHEVSLTAWAYKRRCSQEEASLAFLPKLADAICGILPDRS